MGSCIIHIWEIVDLFEVVLSLFAFKSNIDELLWSHRPDVIRNTLYPREELILRVENASRACRLRFVCQLPCHNGRIFGIQAPIHSVSSVHDSLYVVFVPLFCLFVAVYQIRKVCEFLIWRSVDPLFCIITPSCARDFTLRRCREIPGRLFDQREKFNARRLRISPGMEFRCCSAPMTHIAQIRHSIAIRYSESS